MSGWFTASELRYIRSLAEIGMQSEVLIKKRTPVIDENDPSNIYGDDGVSLVDLPLTSGISIKGWLYSQVSPVITVVGGKMALVNTYRLFVPVGTDIESGDHVVIGGNEFIVSDTTAESTWLPLLNVSLRRVE
jgi:hypothetical protein